MGPSPRDSQTPREAIEHECTRRGRRAVVDGCVGLLLGDAGDDDLIVVLGGAPGRAYVAGDRGWSDDWVRVWAARGLLWVWDDAAAPAIIRALGDEAWRVREMAAKVVRRHLVGDAIEAVAACLDDPVARVRIAADRAVVRLTERGA